MGNSVSIIRSRRGLLNKKGKVLLDAFVNDCLRLQLTTEEITVVLNLKMTELLKEYPMPSIRLIRFDEFISLKTFPRYPDNKDLCSNLESIDRNNSLLVFISHCWLRGYSGAEGWDGRPHPDNAAGDKYQLCIEGIKSLRDTYAPRMKDCYVWFDFGCINQDGNPAGELEQLDKIVQCCDCIFTPIVDHDHNQWILPDTVSDSYSEYRAKRWNDGPHAYLNRGWCRVEMLYAANIPVQENAAIAGCVEGKRHTMFETGLAYHCSLNNRPHFLYGTKEYTKRWIPLLLPPLQHSYLTDYNPLQGSLSVSSDLEHIQALMDELRPYLDAKETMDGYKGSTNEHGQADGHGVYHFSDGSVYDGEWKDGKMQGFGTYRLADGGVYQGDWKNSLRDGHGTYRRADGTVYVGAWKEGNEHGHGTLHSVYGDEYEGEWKDGREHGHGIGRYADGNVYEGEWKHGVRHGHGVYRYAVGGEYDGEWQDGIEQGHGVCRLEDGVVYDGEWNDGRRNGHGIFQYADGAVYEGEWKDGRKLGHGAYRSASGGVYDGEWKDGKKHGHGKYRSASGVLFEGEWKNDVRWDAS